MAESRAIAAAAIVMLRVAVTYKEKKIHFDFNERLARLQAKAHTRPLSRGLPPRAAIFAIMALESAKRLDCRLQW